MIYLFTALYCEAHLFIEQYDLIKNPKNTCFQEFYSEKSGILLTITGVGEINAAAAVGSICSVYRPGAGDLLLNVGTCAHIGEGEGIFLCNKIIEQATGKTFYPDMLYRHDFGESALVTGMLPWNGEKAGELGRLKRDRKYDGASPSSAACSRMLYDMEAAAVYQAGSYFFGPHQMMFLKAVSDSGMAGAVSKNAVAQVMETYQEQIFSYISRLLMIGQENGEPGKSLSRKEEALIERLCTDLHCSKTMSDSLRGHIRYLLLTGTDYAAVIEEMYRQKLLPCKDKREGKLRFEELKQRLF